MTSIVVISIGQEKIGADMFVVVIECAKSDGEIEGVIPHQVDGELFILQYADDKILFMEHDIKKARNMKLIISTFEQLSGLKINFHKSNLFCFGDERLMLTCTLNFSVAGKVKFLLCI
jgi:hypothetical protein